jgi:hypothetical protein
MDGSCLDEAMDYRYPKKAGEKNCSREKRIINS